MNQGQLHEQLQKLQQTLAQHPQLDAQSLVLLQEIAAELKEMGVDAEPELGDILKAQALEFEHSYPKISAVLNQLVDTLGKIGI